MVDKVMICGVLRVVTAKNALTRSTMLETVRLAVELVDCCKSIDCNSKSNWFTISDISYIIGSWCCKLL